MLSQYFGASTVDKIGFEDINALPVEEQFHAFCSLIKQWLFFSELDNEAFIILKTKTSDSVL